MHTVAAFRQNLDDRHTTHPERVGHQRAVASPRHRFGAHDRNGFLSAQVNEFFKRVLKLLGLHVIGVAAKAPISPAGVRRIFASMPQTPQRLHMHIFEMLRHQGLGQGGVVELRIMARAGDCADVHELCDAIDLQHAHKALGGLRRARKDSPNTGWRNGGFRGYADYMQTEEFQDALETLIHMSRRKRVAIMCAEAVPWRCHRSLVADALCVRGVPAVEILSDSSYRMHTLTPFAQVEGVRITYPPDQGTLL